MVAKKKAEAKPQPDYLSIARKHGLSENTVREIVEEAKSE